MLMDLALQSTHEKMTFRLEASTIGSSLPKHDLIKRVVKLYISAGRSRDVLCT
jgi:hypothetical protein